MAYLNVPARRIETKIAYVGPDLAGKTTNLQRLQLDTTRGHGGAVEESLFEGAPLFALDWRPLAMDRVSDCDVAVRVLAARGELTPQRLDALLDDVDGVVVVVDADPSAQDENRRAVSLVRRALEKERAAPLPVVVQLNKCDVDGALDAGALAATLPIEPWPVVRASAARGEGVVETLEAAVRGVVDALKAGGLDVAPSSPARERAHTPLLAALRQILRETVSEHMAQVETAMLRRVTEAVAAPIHRVEAGLDAVTRSLASVEAHLAHVDAASREACTRSEFAAEGARWREEVVARAKSDREHLGAAIAGVKRAVDSVAGDVKRGEGRESLALLEKRIEGVGARVDALARAVDGAAAVARETGGRVNALEAGVTRELREIAGPRLARLDEAVHLVHVDTADAQQRADERVAEVKAVLDDLVERLKQQPKKSWFG